MKCTSKLRFDSNGTVATKRTVARALRSVIAVAAILGAVPTHALADIYIIVNAETTVSADDIKSIFLGDKELAGSVKIRPLDNSSAKDEFLLKVLQMSSLRYESLWMKKSFRDGISPPAERATDEEVLALVKSTPGAIGYLKSPPPSGVTLLKKF